jgi:hypothetical protein
MAVFYSATIKLVDRFRGRLLLRDLQDKPCGWRALNSPDLFPRDLLLPAAICL